MKISAVIPYVAWIGFRNQLLVVSGDNGQYGWGESGLSGRNQRSREPYYRVPCKDPRQIGGLGKRCTEPVFRGWACADRSHIRYRHRPVRSSG